MVKRVMRTEGLSPKRPTKTVLKLGVFDIDGTLRTAKDPWIHLLCHLGFAGEAERHHQWFDQGKITYQEWVDFDAALWKGFHRDEIIKALDTNPLKAGSIELLGWFRSRNIPIIGISSGLDIFNQVVEQQFGFMFIRSNEVLFDENGICLGQTRIHVREDGKGAILQEVLTNLNVDPESIVAFGDGSADIQLFEIAGLSIAITPTKEKVRDAADHTIDQEPIDSALIHLTEYFAID